MEFTKFTKDHIGCAVTDRDGLDTGTIASFKNSDDYPVRVKFKGGNTETYTASGYSWRPDDSYKNPLRELYFGHSIKVEVTGEEVPEPRLVCPVCKCEHEIGGGGGNAPFVYFLVEDPHCPFFHGRYSFHSHAKQVMGNFISAMEKS